MPPDTKIYSITAREILDSRAIPTIETTVILNSGYRGTASVPSGASKSSYEAIELRDNDNNRYAGKGVLRAVTNVNTTISAVLRGMDALAQMEIDKKMIELDGTQNKTKLGANAIISVSHAVAVAASQASRIPLYIYLNNLFNTLFPTRIERIPSPTFNVINGGAHGAGNLDFQEFLVIPASNKKYFEALRMGAETYYEVRKILKYRNAIHSVGDEGGFAPNLYTNLDALEVLIEALRNTRYRYGVDIFLGLDIAAHHFKSDRGYQIKDRPTAYNPREFIDYLKELHRKYRILYLEDPLDEDDWANWTQLTAEIGEDVLVVGDDHLATSPERLQKAIKQKSCSALLAKPNQIGTLTEYLGVIMLAKKSDIKVNVSHRSGETTDTFIADLAVAVQSDYVKFGAPARGERTVKYNRLLQIEAELFPERLAESQAI